MKKKSRLKRNNIMSDYNSLRLKRNAEIQNAMANVRKDLYAWKPSAPKNIVKLTTRKVYAPPLRLESLESASGPLSTKRSESVENVNQPKAKFNSNSALNLSSRPQSENSKNLPLPPKNVKKPSEHRPPPVEFLTEFSPMSNIDHEERIYLNSARNRMPMTSKRTEKELENEFVIFRFFKKLTTVK